MAETDPNQAAIETEIWRPVPGFCGVYSISNLGNIRRERTHKCWKAGEMKIPDRRKDYDRVSLFNGPIFRRAFVHILVAEAFIGPKPHGLQVNHKDGNKKNNAIT